MKLHSDLPVYKSTYDLLLGIFEFTKSFSKEYKYTVGESLKKETFSICQSEFISIAKRFICLIIDSVICENPFNPFKSVAKILSPACHREVRGNQRERVPEREVVSG